MIGLSRSVEIVRAEIAPLNRMISEVLPSRVDALETFIRKSSNAAAFLESLDVNSSGKRKIGDYVAHNIIEQGVVVLDAGSTSYEIAKSIAFRNEIVGAVQVFTNNIPASMVLTLAGVDCKLIGGRIDPSHFCTLPDVELSGLKRSVRGKAYQAIISAAAVEISPNSGISIRARRPDQFAFKRLLLETAAKKVIVIDHTKWRLPFDGQYSFQVSGSGIHLVVDKILPSLNEEANLTRVFQRRGYYIHIAGD